jgi:prefoldin alpha subunit
VVHLIYRGGNTTNPEEEFQRYAVMIENYREQLQLLESQSSLVQATLLDYTKAKMTLEHLDKTKTNADVLLPLGGGAYIDAKTNQTNHVYMDVGAGIVIEKTTGAAVEKLDQRIQALQKNLEQIGTMMQQVQNEADAISAKMEQLLAQSQQKKG